MNQEHRDMALKRHKHHIANRYIEVYKATGEDFINVAGGRTTEAETFLTQGADVIIRMRGLPYDCTASQIISFFESGPEDKACHVMNGEEGVLFVKKPDKKATGDAFVLFAEDADAPKALSKHRQLIGVRYIELFRSTPAEVQQVLNRSLDTKAFENKIVMPQIPPPVPLVPQFVITSGARKDCIRLRGLPYEASVENILEFLGDFSKNIVYQGVHMVYNSQGQPSGEAFIQMDSEGSAFQAAQGRHHRYMIYGKKQRYIEVFQCSSDDMNLVPTGGLPSTNATSPVAKALISPGMLSSSGSSPTPTVHPTVFTQPPPTMQNPWDSLMNGHLLNSLQVQSAVQQNMIRQSQPELWMMNPTLQHLAASQMNLALAKQNWVDLSGTAATPSLIPPHQSLPALPSPNVASSAPTTNIASSSIATSPSTSMVSSSAMMATPQSAAYLPQHFAQAQPLYLYVPPRLPTAHFQPELPPPTVQSPNHQQTLQSLQSAYALTPNSLVPTNPQVSQLMGVKRSWEQAFPPAQNPLSPTGNAMKRQFSYPSASNATALYSVPPPGQTTMGFQTTQFFHATI